MELHVISVVRPPEFGDEVETRAVIENSRRHYEKVLGALSERLAKQPVAFRSSLVVGHPARSLPTRIAPLRWYGSNGATEMSVQICPALIDDNLEASGVSPRGDTEPEVKIDPPQTELT